MPLLFHECGSRDGGQLRRVKSSGWLYVLVVMFAMNMVHPWVPKAWPDSGRYCNICGTCRGADA
jgi:hypothetical protein